MGIFCTTANKVMETELSFVTIAQKEQNLFPFHLKAMHGNRIVLFLLDERKRTLIVHGSAPK